MKKLEVNPRVSISLSELRFSFVRSSGPGGQNVNKVNTKAVLKWSLVRSRSLTFELKEKLSLKLKSKLNQNSEIVLSSDRYRDRTRNQEDCIEKFRALLKKALHIPKKRKKTKQSKASRERAKRKNQAHSEKKRLRQKYKV